MSIAQSRRNKIFRIFWKSVCIEQILLSRALPILPDWQWLEILGFCFPITSQDHLLAHQQTLWVKKKPTFPPRCNFRCSVHLLHFSDPLLTRVSKATCGQAGDSKSSENWSTRGCPKIQSFQVGSRIETKVCSSKYSSTVDLQKLKIYWFQQSDNLQYMADVWNMKASIILFLLLHSIFYSAFWFFMFAFWLSWLGLITMIRKYYLKS